MHTFGRLRRHASRIVFVSFLVLLLVITANAYTVVMRSGRRVEIPSRFVVTKTTLTYEVSPGIQITLAMAAIDIPATEKANNEQPGSLLRREQSGERELVAAPVSSTAARTITNRDLQTSMRRRRESELAYETRRKQLGLPTLEESRRKTATVPDFKGTALEQMLVAEKESEEYWRGRASELRTETAALDAELGYIQARLDEMPSSTWTGSSTIIDSPFAPYISFGNVGGRHSYPWSGRGRPLVYGTRGGDSQLNGRIRFGGGATRGRAGFNPGRSWGRRQFGGVPNLSFRGAIYGSIGQPYHGSIGQPYYDSIGQPYDFSYERNELVTQFNQLAATRAGLNARWRELEDEARRAGAPPGWLRR